MYMVALIQDYVNIVCEFLQSHSETENIVSRFLFFFYFTVNVVQFHDWYIQRLYLTNNTIVTLNYWELHSSVLYVCTEV